MKLLFRLLGHMLVTLARLASPGGVRSVVAESLAVKSQSHGCNKKKAPTRATIFVLSVAFGIWIVKPHGMPAAAWVAICGVVFTTTCGALSFALLALFVRCATRRVWLFDSLSDNEYGMYLRRIRGLLILSIGSVLLAAVPASAASWTEPDYLYRYFTWGARRVVSPRSDDYKSYGYHTIDNAPNAFHFAAGRSDSVPTIVEYREGENVKQTDLSELLRSTDTHAFIVVRDNEVLYEQYFNGFARDSICTTWSVSKSVTSALVGIAIGEGYVKSIDDPITKYLPELRGHGFDAITIRNLLTMGSGIRYRFGFFPWDEFVLAGYYPNLTQLLLSDLQIVEPPGQSFHYNNFNTELIGLILQRTTHRAPSKYLEEKIWKPLGMEYPATWSVDSESDDFELTPILLNARAIDMAKFGRLYLNGGDWDSKQILPASWVAESTTRDPRDNRPWETFSRWQNDGGYYKYFWWGISQSDGDYSYMGIGTYGQFVFVSPRTKVVIVRTADSDGIDPPYWRQVFQYIAQQVDKSYGQDHRGR